MASTFSNIPSKVGVIGTGGIGQRVAEKMSSLVAEVVCFDKYPNHEWIKKVEMGKISNK